MLAGLTVTALGGADFVEVADGARTGECPQAAITTVNARAGTGPIQNGRMRS
jgi:hypothetical protein